MIKTIEDRLKGCLVGGAVGDALGSVYESQPNLTSFSLGKIGGITDDTQLTLATCESIIELNQVSPSGIANSLLRWYNQGRLVGLGSSTLKALRDLQMGAHWGLSGRTGEYAAGNGAAMRIAPLAFFLDISEQQTLIRDICFITHKSDEAYVAALSILYVIKKIINSKWNDESGLIALITPEIPDTRVKDNLLTLQECPQISIGEAAKKIGCSGHAPESVPLAIFSAQKIREMDGTDILSEIISCGGDTDTNASLTGQIIGAFAGYSNLPAAFISAFDKISERDSILKVSENLARCLLSSKA